MSSHMPFPEEEYAPRLMCGDPVALAYKWIESYAENLSDLAFRQEDEYDKSPITVDELIDTALSHVDSETLWSGDYITRGGAFEGVGVDPTFWDKLAIVKGAEIPQESRNNFFSCSC